MVLNGKKIMKNKYKIVLLDAATLGEVSALDKLAQYGAFTAHAQTKASEVLERIKDADVVITNKVVLTASDIQQANALKLICVAATGINNIDLKAAADKGIPVKNVKGYSTFGVAQQTFAAILSLVHRLPFLDAYVKNGSYSRGEMFTYIQEDIFELKGKTMGIVGLGEIGKQVASIAKVFGCEVIYYSTSGQNSSAEYSRVSWEELLSKSDIISIHAPLNEQTKGLFNYEAMCKMKCTAIIHNAGRGGIIIEDDLCNVLQENKIKAAAIDVYEFEPLASSSPLLKVELQNKLLLTPHTAWAAKESRERLVEGILNNIKEVFG
jgi:lactate dehydrogenase-like 2-hydroxyacid dehydrogenase